MKCLHQKRNVGSIEVNGKTPADFNGARISSQISIQPQGHSGTLGLQWPHLILSGQNTWFREPPEESLHWCTWAKTILCSVWSSIFKCLTSSYSEISLPISMNGEDSYLVLDKTKYTMIFFYFSITICNGCKMQYLHYYKPNPLVYHHTIAGNQMREV